MPGRAVCLVILRCALCSWCAGEKNHVWRLRGSPSGVLRSAAPVGGRSGVWRYADLLGVGGAAGAVPPVWHGEAGRPGLAGRPFVLHEAVRVLGGPPLPSGHDQGCRRGDASRLAHHQELGDAINARAAAPRRDPGPRAIGIDEISIRKGHTYRIVVSDLDRMRPIWFGGTDRSEASMDEFFAWLGPKKCRRIQLAVMDMRNRFAIPPSATRRRPTSCSTSSTSCATSAMPSTRCASASTHA
jgi:hypothetical protein